MSKKMKSFIVVLCFCLASSVTLVIPQNVEASTKKVASSSSSVSKKKQAAKPIKKTSLTCVIKGNISSKKEKIYHVPGCASYNETIIETSKGEVMFCTEAEAKVAGWRKALNCPK